MRGYNGRFFIREQVYICGDYMDADIYPVFQTPGKRRRKCNPSSEVQQRLNQKNAEKKLIRLVHANFGAEDLALTLTYDDHPEEIEQAEKDLRNFLRRVKRFRKKHELGELKYITCTEMSGKGRFHHHLIVNGGIDRDKLENLWGKGYANSKRLQFGDDGVAGLAKYMVKDRMQYHRWNSSRNLVRPQPVTFDARITMGDAEEMQKAIESRNAWTYFEDIYEDFFLTNAEYMLNQHNRGLYIHIDMRRKNYVNTVGRAAALGTGTGETNAGGGKEDARKGGKKQIRS